MSLRSPLGRARGLGSAKAGTDHWWAQRWTALALVPLVLWFVASLVAMVGADLATVRDWVASPVVAVLLVLLIAATFYHGALGLQVVIEDYIHHEGAKTVALLANKAVMVVLALTGVLSVLSIFFRG